MVLIANLYSLLCQVTKSLGKNMFTDFPKVIKKGNHLVGFRDGIVRLPRFSENSPGSLLLVF